MKNYLLALFLIGTVCLADVPNEDVSHRINSGYSFAPILGYDPTFGALIGAAAFRGSTKDPLSNGSLLFYGSTKKNFAGEFSYTYWDDERMFYKLDVKATDFFTAYFGEGSNTSVDNKVKIDTRSFSFIPAVGYRFNRDVSLSLYTQVKYRDETGVDGDTTRRVFGKEFTPIVGMTLAYDLRDNQIDTKKGSYVALSVDGGPAALSSRPGATSFARAEGDVRQFIPATESLVFAAQLRGGISTGNPSYLYRYAIGGSGDMRGYQSNRMRGNYYYLAQLEARLKVLSWLTLAAFGGGGDVANVSFSDFGNPKATYGGGIRIGLPPNLVAKARIDFGVSQDEKNFYLVFNEAF